MQAIHGQFQSREQIVFQAAEVGGQQQLAITGGGELVIDTQVAALPAVGQVQHQNRFIDLYPFHALIGEPLQDLAVHGNQAVQQGQLAAVVGAEEFPMAPVRLTSLATGTAVLKM